MMGGETPESGGSPTELRSWKQIAEYLGVEARTAQKWEKERGLPVRRYPGGRGRVVARVSELEAWKAASLGTRAEPEEPAQVSQPLLKRYVPAIAIAVFVLAAGALWVLTRPGLPARAKIEDNALVVFDASGRRLWSRPFEFPPSPIAYPEKKDSVSPGELIRVTDIDGDGRVEIVVAEDPDLVAEPGATAVLLCLDQGGRERWRLPIDWRVKFAGGREVPPSFFIRNVLPARVGRTGRPVVLVSAVNMREEPGWFAEVSPDGRIQREYWHAGHLGHAPGLLRLFDLDGDGVDEILLGGINNPRGQATLVVLDPDTFEGASTEDSPEFQIVGRPPEHGTTRLFFPRSCLNLLIKPFNEVEMVSPTGTQLGVTIRELEWTREALIDYYLRMPDWTTVERTPVSAKFRAEHHRLHSEGVLNHDLDDAEIQSFRAIRVLHSPGGPLPSPSKAHADTNY